MTTKSRNVMAVGVIVALLLGALDVRAQAPIPQDGEGDQFPKATLGIKLGGGGIGPTFRGDLAEKFSLGISALYRPYVLMNEASGRIKESGSGVMIPIEAICWTSQIDGEPNGPKRHGVGLVGGYCLSKYPQYMVVVSYEYERFKNHDHVYSASVGAGYLSSADLPDGYEQATNLMIYWAFAWHWGAKGEWLVETPADATGRP